MALQELGQPAVSLTGMQVGIVTEALHSQARILRIQIDRLERHLEDGKVVVVAGFQGMASTQDLEITTLGRGGSDTSAVALAAALQADRCEIYTDVPGILTTDPRLIADAQLMAEITSDEMLELASLGAKVLHPRAVEIARNYGIPLVVRSSWTEDPGTWVLSPVPRPRPLDGLELAPPVNGVEVSRDQAKVALLRVLDRPGVAAQLFGTVASQGLDVDLIIQSIHEGNSNDIAFTVGQASLQQAEAIASACVPAFAQGDPQAEVMVDDQVAKISIKGAGMIGRPGVAAQMFTALAAADVNIQMISTSEVKISCIVAASVCDRAITALSDAFSVEAHSVTSPTLTNRPVPSSTPAVRGVALDCSQARLAICHIPDRPGMAAKLFALLVQENISVDMIIQSQRCRLTKGVVTRDLAFTVARRDAAIAHQVLAAIAPTIGFDDLVLDTQVAKVSVVGAGMVGQPGVAARMFTALAEHQINIQMIATSEIKISCVVAWNQGEIALRAIHAAFGLSGS